jgi:2-oxoisovalerate dehydrogenase E1 component
VEEVDGTDVLKSLEAAEKVIAHARERKGPALLHAHVIRPYSHSMSDDERMYRRTRSGRRRPARDPLVTFRKHTWRTRASPRPEELDALEKEVAEELNEAADRALEQPQPAPETAMKWLYSEEVDPTSSAFDSEDSPRSRARRPPWWTS